MTASTEQERAEFQEWALSKWPLMDVRTRSQDGNYADFETRTRFMAWQEAAARRAPAVPLRKPTIDEVAEAVGYHDSAWDCVDPSELIDAILMLAAAPQPPEADMGIPISQTNQQVEAPVQLPEPVANLWQHGETGRTRVVMPDAITDCDARWQHVGALYTEQQVRQLLEAHGIEVAP